jgi:hypothetical protein
LSLYHTHGITEAGDKNEMKQKEKGKSWEIRKEHWREETKKWWIKKETEKRRVSNADNEKGRIITREHGKRYTE